MAKLPLAELERLVREIIHPFYRIERKVPLYFSPGRHENDAEHSWSLALLACALAPHIDRKLDAGLICQFAMVHDLVEVYAGDTPNFLPDDQKADKQVHEDAVLERLQQEFKNFSWIIETIRAYEAQQTDEARFVKSVDKILPLLMDCIDQGLCYLENKVSHQAFRKFMKQHCEKAMTHPGAFEYYDQVWNYLLAHPEFYYQGKQ